MNERCLRCLVSADHRLHRPSMTKTGALAGNFAWRRMRGAAKRRAFPSRRRTRAIRDESLATIVPRATGRGRGEGQPRTPTHQRRSRCLSRTGGSWRGFRASLLLTLAPSPLRGERGPARRRPRRQIGRPSAVSCCRSEQRRRTRRSGRPSEGRPSEEGVRQHETALEQTGCGSPGVARHHPLDRGSRADAGAAPVDARSLRGPVRRQVARDAGAPVRRPDGHGQGIR